MADNQFKGMNADDVADLVMDAKSVQEIDNLMGAVAKSKDTKLRNEVVDILDDESVTSISLMQGMYGQFTAQFDRPGDGVLAFNKRQFANELQKFAQIAMHVSSLKGDAARPLVRAWVAELSSLTDEQYNAPGQLLESMNRAVTAAEKSAAPNPLREVPSASPSTPASAAKGISDEEFFEEFEQKVEEIESVADVEALFDALKTRTPALQQEVAEGFVDAFNETLDDMKANIHDLEESLEAAKILDSMGMKNVYENEQDLEDGQMMAQLYSHVVRILGDKVPPAMKTYVEEVKNLSDEAYNSLSGHIEAWLKTVRKSDPSAVSSLRPNPLRNDKKAAPQPPKP